MQQLTEQIVSAIRDLPWLPAAPGDFKQQVRSLTHMRIADAHEAARQLAGYRLNFGQLHTLGTALEALPSAAGSEVTRLGVLSNGTSNLLLPTIGASALRHGLWLRAIGTPYDQVAAEAFNPSSDLNQAQCHFVLLSLDHRGLGLQASPGDSVGAAAAVHSALQYVDSVRHALRSASGSTLILQTVPQVPESFFGSLDRSVPGTQQWIIEQFNRELRLRADESSDLLLDAAALAETVGLSHWHDPVQWTLGKFSFSHAVVPIYSEWLARLVAAARGKARKCLVLDLDNTIWGGVIGDDGLDGIDLDNGTPAGESFLQIQRAALTLRQRGVVLAVASKNDDTVARNPFRLHPDMLLKEDHIAVFQANWQDKPSNLVAIAAALNMGVDALVLLDDNPAERALVRSTLPTVAVPELPDDPAMFTATLLAAGYFESVTFTKEDRDRAAQYHENAARAQALVAASDLESYLRSLQMRAICSRFDRLSRPRITQLINKTNQFNLTTRRYTESEVEALEQSGVHSTLCVRLIDRFGDNGIVSVMICIGSGPDWVIDTWLMSCRVLNRKLEHAMLNHIMSRARKAGVRELIGHYLKTDRNGIVRDVYPRLGFSLISCDESGSQWRLDVARYNDFIVPLELTDQLRCEASRTGS